MVNEVWPNIELYAMSWGIVRRFMQFPVNEMHLG